MLNMRMKTCWIKAPIFLYHNLNTLYVHFLLGPKFEFVVFTPFYGIVASFFLKAGDPLEFFINPQYACTRSL